MREQIQKVVEFHKAFGCPVGEVKAIDRNRIMLRHNLLQEEVTELLNASYNGDIVETVDALGDILYIVFGTAVEFGVAGILSKAFDEIHRSNMSKLDTNGQRVVRADGKILKSSLYSPPDLKTIVLGEEVSNGKA